MIVGRQSGPQAIITSASIPTMTVILRRSPCFPSPVLRPRTAVLGQAPSQNNRGDTCEFQSADHITPRARPTSCPHAPTDISVSLTDLLTRLAALPMLTELCVQSTNIQLDDKHILSASPAPTAVSYLQFH